MRHFNEAARGQFYADLIAAPFTRTAPVIDPIDLYCPHGDQWSDCGKCEGLPEYRGDDRSLYASSEEGKR